MILVEGYGCCKAEDDVDLLILRTEEEQSSFIEG